MQKLYVCVVWLWMILGGATAYCQKEGYEAIDSMRQVMIHTKVDTDRLKVFYRIGDAYASLDPEKSLEIALKGLQESRMLRWKKGMGAFHLSIGNILSDKGYYDSAIAHFDTSYELNEQIQYARGAYSALMNIGTAYQRRGFDNAALDYYLKALPMIDASDKYNLTMVNLDIAGIYCNQQNAAKSLSYAFKGLNIAKQNDFLPHIALALKVIANSYVLGRDTPTAKMYMTQSLEKYQSLGDLVGEASLYYALGIIAPLPRDRIAFALRSKGIWDSINPTYPLALANLTLLGNEYLSSVINSPGNNLSVKGLERPLQPTALQLATLYLEKAASLSRTSGDIDNLAEALKSLSRLNEAKGNDKLALSNIKEYIQLSDSLYSQENKNRLAQQEAGYQFEKKEARFLEQQHLSALHIRQLWIYSALILAFAIALFLYFLNRYRLNQLKLKNAIQLQQADQKQRELILQNQLTASRLKAIRAQMNPHFFFNVLNSIESYIMESKPDIASSLLQKFAVLCRLILENSDQRLVSVQREWQALQLYTELEAERFSHEFAFEFSKPDDLDLSNFVMPSMMIQPLIENAIHHGLRHCIKPGLRLSVSMAYFNSALQITVDDNGVGLVHSKPGHLKQEGKLRSLGLTMIRERIAIINEALTGDIASLEITNKVNVSYKIQNVTENGSGVRAVLTLPVFAADSDLSQVMGG